MSAEPGAIGFFNGEAGPVFSFTPTSGGDGTRYIALRFADDKRPKEVVATLLEAADVRQLRQFCNEWLWATMTQRELDRDADAMVATADQLRVLADRRQG